MYFLFPPIPNSRLERDSGSWNLEEEEVQRRRNIFWECCTWDCWAVSATVAIAFEWLMRLLQSILYGRPPVLDLAHSDCRFPRDLEPHVLPSGKSELGCENFLYVFLESIVFRSLTPFFHLVHSWMFHYIAACLSISVQRTHSVNRGSYPSFIELDKRIRSFPIPSYLHSPVYGTERRDWDTTPFRAMRQYFAPCALESSK